VLTPGKRTRRCEFRPSALILAIGVARFNALRNHSCVGRLPSNRHVPSTRLPTGSKCVQLVCGFGGDAPRRIAFESNHIYLTRGTETDSAFAQLGGKSGTIPG
jgi:hypothetical protein